MLRLICLDPVVAVAVVAVDMMLFGATAAALGIGWIASIPIGLALGVAVTLVQRRAPANDLGLAVGKGLIVAILTAIPTPLPSLLVAGAGVAGAMDLWRLCRRELPRPVPEGISTGALQAGHHRIGAG